MNGFRVWTDIVLVTLASRYKWILGATAAVAVVVGGLFVVGVFGGGAGDGSGLQAGVPTAAAPSPTAVSLIPTPVPTLVNIPEPTPLPTLASRIVDVPRVIVEPTPSAPQVVRVPINLIGAYQVGSLEFVLSYEPSLLEVASVTSGDLAADALIESRVSAPGKVWIGLIDVEGITGDGAVAVVSFRTIEGTAANSPLMLEDVSSYNAFTLIDLISRSSPGLMVMYDGSYTAPVLTYD